jgi:uncharacterized protein with LGFP repeats
MVRSTGLRRPEQNVVHGAIRDKWSSLGWETGILGYAKTDEQIAPDHVGHFNHFEHGSIYGTPSTGAHEVHGSIRDKWAAFGWDKSLLGYPISDEENAPGGRVSRFQNGRIEGNRATGAVMVVNTAIRGHWPTSVNRSPAPARYSAAYRRLDYFRMLYSRRGRGDG